MVIFFVWVIGAVIIGAVGRDRKIGFISAFLLSLILSPLIGAIFVATSPIKEPAQKETPQRDPNDTKFLEEKNKDILNYYENGQYKDVLAAIDDILEVEPNNCYALMNAARVYSLMGDKDNAFRYFSLSVSAKYPNPDEMIMNSDFLLLKKSLEYQDFIRYGYKLPTSLSLKSKNTSISLADELKKLAELKESGILTEEEFQVQKQRLLNK